MILPVDNLWSTFSLCAILCVILCAKCLFCVPMANKWHTEWHTEKRILSEGKLAFLILIWQTGWQLATTTPPFRGGCGCGGTQEFLKS